MADQIIESIATGTIIGKDRSQHGSASQALSAALKNLVSNFKKAWSDSGNIATCQLNTLERHVFQADSDLRSLG